MSAHDALNGQQFVHHTEIAKMYSGDYDVPMTQHLRTSRRAYSAFRHDGSGYGEEAMVPGEGAMEHGGPDRYVDHLAKDIAQNGMREPITVRGGNVITDGHHRALAAMKLGMDRVPVRHVR